MATLVLTSITYSTHYSDNTVLVLSKDTSAPTGEKISNTLTSSKFTLKISVPKFPLYDLYFPRYASKTPNLKIECGAKMWYKKLAQPVELEVLICCSWHPNSHFLAQSHPYPKMFASVFLFLGLLEACICQRAVQSLRSGEKKERASWTKRGMFLILLTCRIDIYSPFRPLSLS